MQKSVYRNLLAGLFTATALTASGQLFPFHSGDSLSILPTPGQNESYLGTYLSEVTPELVDQLSLQEESGAHVNQVVAGTPADNAGIETDDVIIRWNERRVESARQLTRLVRETPPGRSVQLELIRKGDTITLGVDIGTRDPVPGPEDRAPFFHTPPQVPGPDTPWFHPSFGEMPKPGQSMMRPRLGVIMQPLTEQLADYFKLEGRLGALISTVMEDTPAANANLKAGDVLLSVNGNAVESPREVQWLVRSAAGESLLLRIMREGTEIDVEIALAETDSVHSEDTSEPDDEQPQAFPTESL